MKQRYVVQLSFLGTNYNGWQRQISTKQSVQEVLESAFLSILKENITCICCGRTDAGVHASYFIVHFDTAAEIIPSRLIQNLNFALPGDISVHDVWPVSDEFHARYRALSRSYVYRFHIRKDAYKSTTSALYMLDHLDYSLMETATKLFVGEHDFYYFCKTPERHKHTLCNVKACQIHSDADLGQFEIHITANRFLKNMVRIIAYKIILAGKNAISIDEINSQLNRTSSPKYFEMGYPQGLHFQHVAYPEHLFLPAEA